MNAISDMSLLSGIEQVRAIYAGNAYEGILKALNIHFVSAEEGLVVFEGSLPQSVYNPIDSVHSGYAATLLDTVMTCAVHTCLTPGQVYTMLVLKISYHRPLSDASRPARAEGRIVSHEKGAAFAEGKLFDKDGTLCATATTTCLVLNKEQRHE